MRSTSSDVAHVIAGSLLVARTCNAGRYACELAERGDASTRGSQGDSQWTFTVMSNAVLNQRRRLRPLWIRIAAIAGLAQVAVGYLALHPHPFETIEQHAARLSNQHGILVGFGDPSKFFVPPLQAAALEGMQLPAASPDAVAIALDSIETSLATYPPGFVSSLMLGLFIGGDLRVKSELSGGFAGPNWFVLAAPEADGPEIIRLTSLLGVHHELSSFVLQKTGAQLAWAALSPPEWRFAATREAALARGSEPDPPLDTGFLSAYGATTAENDFNTYAERIFTEPAPLMHAACEHTLISKKLRFVVQTYVELDARMGRVFRELGIDVERPCS